MCEGDSGVIPGSPMLFAGEGLAIASVKEDTYSCHNHTGHRLFHHSFGLNTFFLEIRFAKLFVILYLMTGQSHVHKITTEKSIQ